VLKIAVVLDAKPVVGIVAAVQKIDARCQGIRWKKMTPGVRVSRLLSTFIERTEEFQFNEE
jgi:hypothetical protein